jgi:DNA-binding transcriptional LysR family regulator
MEMQQIRYFLALASTLNFTRAAEECNVSQPSLTRAIRLLEEELGGELLRRERRQSHLTDLGERMLPLMRQCYESALSAKNLARELKTNAVAPLSIAVSHTVNLSLLMPQLDELSRAFPGVQLRIKRGTAQEIIGILKEGGAELAVAGPLGEEWDRLDRWPVHEERYDLLVCREHSLAERGKIEVTHLVGERFLVRVGCEMTGEVTRQLSEHGVQLASAHEVENDQDLIALLEANFGIAFSPLSAPFTERLLRLPVQGLNIWRKITVYGVAGRRRSPAGTALLNLLRAADWTQPTSARSSAH